MPNKLTTEEFIRRSKEKFENKFGYLNTTYNGRHKKLSIICPVHGETFITPTVHLSDNHTGCSLCQLDNSRDPLAAFIEKSNKVHSNYYSYEKSEYLNSRTKLEIICPIHGSFYQTPNAHIYSANGCPDCGMNVKIESFKNSKIFDTKLNYIYLFEISSKEELFHKVGITYQNPFKRMENIKSTSNKKYNCKLIWSTDKNIETYKSVEIEKYISNLYINSKYIPATKFSGYTECYQFEDIQTVIANLEVAIQDKCK